LSSFYINIVLFNEKLSWLVPPLQKKHKDPNFQAISNHHFILKQMYANTLQSYNSRIKKVH
jgi:hypothetical protein